MDRYTVDAVAALRYLVDSLPGEANRLFDRAEGGEVLLQIPSIAIAETLYVVEHKPEVHGRSLAHDPATARENLVTTGPLTVVGFGNADLSAFLDGVDSLTLHDAMVVASHHTQDTDAVITSDGAISESSVPTIWA